MKRKIAVFTGTRAEYGLLYWIIKGIHESKTNELQLYVGGTHLSEKYGYTINQIEKDGFPIKHKLDFLDSSDSSKGIAKSLSSALIQAEETFSHNNPDILIVLGDRYELLSICQAAMLRRIPIAHIHGGEITEGAMDDAIRHSISKMSHLHFTSTEIYRSRVIQLGEAPEKVFNVGAPGIDNIKYLKLLDRNTLAKSINFDFESAFFIVTYHPVTLYKEGGIGALKNLLRVLKTFKDYNLVISYPNADPHNQKLINLLELFHKKYPSKVYLAKSLGQLNYLSLLKNCELVIGNSSSGIIEAPSFNKPTINIGTRQSGRIKGGTVIDCDEAKISIKNAILKGLSENFKKKCISEVNPYGSGEASIKILDILNKTPLDKILTKKFYDA